MRPLEHEKCWLKGFCISAEGLLTRLRWCGEGWSIGLQFFEHLTVRSVASEERVVRTVAEVGHGWFVITPKRVKSGQIRAN